jgi:hypothetical protein
LTSNFFSSEVAKLLGVDPATVTCWIQKGKIKGAVRIPGEKHWKIAAYIVANAKKIWRDNVLSVKIPHSTLFSRSYAKQEPITTLEAQAPRHDRLPGACGLVDSL